MPSVGEELKRERELRGISLEEIAGETKISVRFLEAIDTGRMDTIPGEFYRRSSLRAYATYLGIDADRILATYDFHAAARSSPPEPPQPVPSRLGHLLRARWAKWAAVAVSGLALTGGVLAVWLSGPPEHPGVSLSPPALESPGTAAVGPSAPLPPMAGPVVGEEVEEEPAMETPLRLILKVNEPCWLEVHGDGDIVAQGLMLRGFEKEIQAREEIRLWLGNAGGVSIWINERPGISLGRPGQVRKDLRITPDNFTEFIASEEEPQVLPVSGDRAGAQGLV